jgi:DNA-binding MurR/RpiR family transcriptional regulator
MAATNATASRPGPAVLDERIAALRDDLSPAEAKVAEFIARHREEAVFVWAAEIARELRMSDATVIRTAQTLGYAGLPELKAELQNALRTRATPALRLGRSLEDAGADPAAILDHVLSTELELVADARRTLLPTEFARALELLAGAGRVLVFGVGPNGPHAEYAALRLGRLRRTALAITARGLGLADALLGLRKGDVILAIAYERLTPETRIALDRAHELGLHSVLITDTLGLALTGRFTAALTARRSGSGMYHQSAITMVVLDALLLGLAARDRVAALGAAEELERIRERITAG